MKPIELKGKNALSRNELKALMKLCELAVEHGLTDIESTRNKLARAFHESKRTIPVT